ncbi:hypothetical protein K9U39_04360 [Rhodoblastus acidophilus]|jgi:hypothetical protein|uniref:Uncharacterized protein n=1 Tax=Candidatus Rhodoblastus alkanivorans TaxID=2954117 RepID=A0ABS9Z658_9HYPH|nr:hypothetical protein [Candidatus Rhodoblastus alkanivorans]MCI4678452.1 hypothetical protein [Candidatus Rhodoblastus alkanivorans]MCI4682875.1 hypothetical protein [Candidatus Rhodoblastus alkanivorans]MDI4640184.1 hypothetical protein [Rhodoblastus acidophilus]
MTVVESLRKNGHFLLTGFLSAVVLLVVMRWSDGAPLFQPQSDFGILIGAALVAGFLIYRDVRGSNGKQSS